MGRRGDPDQAARSRVIAHLIEVQSAQLRVVAHPRGWQLRSLQLQHPAGEQSAVLVYNLVLHHWQDVALSFVQQRRRLIGSALALGIVRLLPVGVVLELYGSGLWPCTPAAVLPAAVP